MKKIWLGAAAAIAIAAPSVAFADTSGYVEGGYENSDYDTGSEFDALHLGGGLYHSMGSGWAIQFDGRTVMQEWDSSSGDDGHGYAALHASTEGSAWDFGGFVGLLDYYGAGGVMIGGETRTNFGDLSLQGNLGYADFDEFFDYSLWDARVDASYFFMPNFAVTGGVGHSEWDYITDYEALTLSIGAAFQFGQNFTVSGEYVNSDFDVDGGTDYEADTFRIALRFDIDGGSLQDNTNDGATWNGGAALHESMLRW
jgi:hypothetical protein